MKAVKRLERMERLELAEAADVARHKPKTWQTAHQAWARLALRMLWVLKRVQAQSIVEAFDRNTKAKSGRAGSSTMHGEDAANTNGFGDPLPASKSRFTGRGDPASCIHRVDWLKARGNQALKWWTCGACGSRWQRIKQTQASVEAVVRKLPPGAGKPPNCPGCRLPMWPKQNRTDQGYFGGCRAFPSCRQTLPIMLNQAIQEAPVTASDVNEFVICSSGGSGSSSESDIVVA